MRTDPSRLHICDACGKAFSWTKQSWVYGSFAHEDEGYRQFKICDKQCKADAPPESMLAYIIGKVQLRGPSRAKLVDDHWKEWDAQPKKRQVRIIGLTIPEMKGGSL